MVAYRKELERKRRRSKESDVISLPEKKQGKSPLLGEKIDAEVQLIIRNMREVGGVINTAIVIFTTMGVMTVNFPSTVNNKLLQLNSNESITSSE